MQYSTETIFLYAKEPFTMKIRLRILSLVLALAASVACYAVPTPVEAHGALSVSGSRIVDEKGSPVQLKGMSLFWSQWGGKYYNRGAIAHTSERWGASVVRIAMGVEMGGYLENPKAEKERVREAVEAARALGIYAIIDWHDHNAHKHAREAAAFFAEMAALYKDTPNVIFEIYNEPLADASWKQVRAYAVEVIASIRGAGANNLVLVGSPHWSQDVNLASAKPITEYGNVAYTLHFYAGSHGASLRYTATAAMKRGIAIFVSEWGTCDASGNGNFSPEASDEWLEWMDENDISWCNWSLFDKKETASALNPGAAASGGWTDADLTESGKYVVGKLMEK
jgi:endoglucanase